MPLLDHNGRILGKLNLFDGFLILVVTTITVLAYQWLTVDYRVAPPYALESTEVLAYVDLQLPRDQAWLCDSATSGLEEVDPRSGEARAKVQSCTVEDGLAIVHLEVHTVRDGAGRLLFEGRPLLPGRTLQLETAAAILEGVVRNVKLEDTP